MTDAVRETQHADANFDLAKPPGPSRGPETQVGRASLAQGMAAREMVVLRRGGRKITIVTAYGEEADLAGSVVVPGFAVRAGANRSLQNFRFEPTRRQHVVVETEQPTFARAELKTRQECKAEQRTAGRRRGAAARHLGVRP